MTEPTADAGQSVPAVSVPPVSVPAVSVPAVSVIVACYNAATFLERCVAAILGQTVASLEVILIDDCSTDTTSTLARELAERDRRVRLDTMPRNGGPAAARNRGVALARGRWVAVVDSDDLLHPARFDTLLREAEASGADMIADDLLVFQDGAAVAADRFLASSDQIVPFDLGLPDYLTRSRLYGAHPNPGFLKPLIRRDRLAATGVRYDETLRIAEDDDLVARLLLAGLRYRIQPIPLYFYRKHGASISHRLSVAALEAMAAADAMLGAAIVARYPALAGQCRARSRALASAAAFERVIAALRERRVGSALRLLVSAPGAWPLLRMPLAGLLAKRYPPLADARQTIAPDDELARLVAQSDATRR